MYSDKQCKNISAWIFQMSSAISVAQLENFGTKYLKIETKIHVSNEIPWNIFCILRASTQFLLLLMYMSGIKWKALQKDINKGLGLWNSTCEKDGNPSFCQNCHLIACLLMEIFLFSYIQYETSPHKKVHLGTGENTEHRQSNFHDRAPHCCSQSSLQDQIEFGSVHILHLREHQTYYWNKDKSQHMSDVTVNHEYIHIIQVFLNIYEHNISIALNSLLHEKKKKGPISPFSIDIS